MHISFFECDEHEERFFEDALPDHSLNFYKGSPEEHQRALRLTEVLVVFIYSRITKDLIHSLPHLRLIVTLSTGYDHIDLKACKERDIRVCNVPKYGGTAVAEHTFALMLALIRHIPRAVQKTAHDDFSLEGLRGIELAGKTLGVIGAGTIGAAVIQRARAFEMKVLAYERTPNAQRAKELGFQHASLPMLLKKSDIVTLHVPYTKETHHLLNRRYIRMMKKGSLLINTARGGLIDTKALHHALTSGHVKAVALDVLEGELEHKEAHAQRKEHHLRQHDWVTIRETHRLLKLPNVIITPHMAFYTEEALTTILTSARDSIRAYEKGTLLNAVC